MHRFYLPDIGSENHVWLEGAEARHLSRVLRVCVGDEVALFDGRGLECLGIVERIDREQAKVAILRRQHVDRDPKLAVTLGCAIVKTRAMALVIDMCTELGLKELVPLDTRRSVPKVAKKEEAHLERWRRYVVEAAKQSGRTRLPRVASPRPFSSFMPRAKDFDLALIFVPDPDAAPLRQVLAAHPDARSVVYLTGPEGGFEPHECEDAEAAGFLPVRLGLTVLRTETAAATALAAILYHYEE